MGCLLRFGRPLVCGRSLGAGVGLVVVGFGVGLLLGEASQLLRVPGGEAVLPGLGQFLPAVMVRLGLPSGRSDPGLYLVLDVGRHGSTTPAPARNSARLSGSCISRALATQTPCMWAASSWCSAHTVMR